jgi:hypothetical protein
MAYMLAKKCCDPVTNCCGFHEISVRRLEIVYNVSNQKPESGSCSAGQYDRAVKPGRETRAAKKGGGKGVRQTVAGR